MLGLGIRRKSQIVYSKPWWWFDPQWFDLCVWGAYQPRRASSLADSLRDVSGNGNDLTDPGGGNTPGWSTVNGWEFDALNSQYLISGFTGDNDQSQTIAIQFSNAVQQAHYLCGAQSAGGTLALGPSVDTVQSFVIYQNGDQAQVAPYLASGNLAVAGDRGYRNGVAEGASLGAYTGALSEPLWVGALNDGGAGLGFLTGYIQALVIFDCLVPPSDLLDIVEWMSEL